VIVDNEGMRLFSSLYLRVMGWSRHPKAAWVLGVLSFAESSFFPIPPDVMLAPMSLAKPHRAWWYATITTVTSVLGGVLGYVIGVYFFDAIAPWLEASRYWESFQTAKTWFLDWGFWAVLIAGFSPIPYKVFTIAAGVMGMPILPFIAASLVGRGGRFYLVAGLMKWGGRRMEHLLESYVDRLGWSLVVIIVIFVLIQYV
jgi:membrane protein YqaA with SNARE-associated domain